MKRNDDPIRKSFTIAWTDVADPHGSAHDIGRQLHILRWLADTADDPAYVQRERWGDRTPFMLLSVTSAYAHHVDAVRSENDLQQRLMYAVIAGHRDPLMERWRADNGIRMGKTTRIRGLHGGAPRAFHELLQKRYDPEDRSLDRRRTARLAVSLNSCHLRAVEFLGVDLRLRHPFPRSRGGVATWSAFLRFGLDGSAWDHELTEEREGESIDAFGHRAHRLLGVLLGTLPGGWGRPPPDRGALPIVDTDWQEKGRHRPAFSVFRDRGYRHHDGLGGNLERVAGPFDTRAEAEDEAIRRIPEIRQ